MAKIDYSKIFIEDACPTRIGGQAVMEGVMMRGPDRTALAMRLPSGELYLKTKKNKEESGIGKLPFVRGIFKFAESLVSGMSTLMESADILEEYAPEEYAEEPGRVEKWINDRFGDKAAWNFLMMSALVFALVVSVVFFIILPTWVVNFLGKWIASSVVLNLIEGLLRIAIFIGYVVAIRRLEDIMTLFRYHGAEHKTIHCFENGLELTPENADSFYTLHPRCGTSFLVFVLIISLLLFSFLGWPNLFWRIVSRLLLIPVIAGISYELLRWAGSSNSAVVRVLSWPGLMLQKLTTAEPTKEQLEVGILSLKAVLVDHETPEISGFVDKDGNLLPDSVEEELETEAGADTDAAAAEPEGSETAAGEAGGETGSGAGVQAGGSGCSTFRDSEFITINDADAESDEAWQAVMDAAADIGEDELAPAWTDAAGEGNAPVTAEETSEEILAPEGSDASDASSPHAGSGRSLQVDEFLREFIDPAALGDPAGGSEPESGEISQSDAAAGHRGGAPGRRAPGQPREVTADPGSPHMTDDETSGGDSFSLENIQAAASEKFRYLTELGKSLLSRLRYEIMPASGQEDNTSDTDLWAEDSEIMKNKLSEAGRDETADEESINEAIRFLSELDKDGYTIVTPDECDVTNIARGIAEHFARDAKARTLARRYTNDISTIENALRWGQAALSMVENGRNEAVMIMSYATGLTRTELVTRGKELMRDDDFAEYEKRIEMRLRGTPLQYILGMTEFMGLPLRVNPSVLIPRPETEVLTEEVIRIMKEKDWPHPEVLDLCTGSGAIGISIAVRVPEALVTMSDVSQEALQTAMSNAGVNGVNRKCVFLLGDMFDALPEEKQFDVIVSNPPYIKSDVIETLAAEVRDHEPRIALDGGEDGLDYYRLIAENASAHLRTGGLLALEIGDDQAGSVKRLLMRSRAWTGIHKLKDLAGRDRVVIAERV